MGLLKWLFCGPKLHGKILERIAIVNKNLGELDFEARGYIQNKKLREVDKIKRKIHVQELILEELKDLIRE